MRNFLKLLYNYHFLILFLFIEGFSLFLIVQNNNFHRTRFTQFANSISGGLFGQMNNFKSYLSLKEANRLLSQENIELRNKLATFRKIIYEKKDTLIDTTYKQQYTYFSAKVINNSVDKQYNYLTLNKGYKDGIKPDMAVISPLGIVGKVDVVSENFATVLSVLNRNFKVSAKFKKNNYFGSLSWDGLRSDVSVLTEIPRHVKVQVGDTVVTSGYSGIFPEGIPIGVVKEFDKNGGNFYIIKIKLTTEFKNLNYVTLIDDLMKPEQQELEKKSEHD